jgi:hypothetical protein
MLLTHAVDRPSVNGRINDCLEHMTRCQQTEGKCTMAGWDPLEQLKKLAELRDSGVINADEFNAKKSQLLEHVGRSTNTASVSQPNIQQGASRRQEAVIVAMAVPLATLSDNDLVGTITPDDLAKAQERLKERESLLHHNEDQCKLTQRQFARSRLRSLSAGSWARVRQIACSTPLGRAGSATILATLIAGFTVVLVGIFSLAGTKLLTGGLIGLILGGAFATILLFIPSDRWLSTRERLYHEKADQLSSLVDAAQSQVQATRDAYEDAVQIHQRLQAIAQSRMHQLLSYDWRTLRGIPFEDFLQQVFEHLGYLVERTKASGDQGVDLILGRNGVRIAVQAKGYAESVGNGAVQEVHAGMAFYRCNRCAVVTNSEFTSSASDLAGRVGCSLIAGSQIPDLIHGNVMV